MDGKENPAMAVEGKPATSLIKRFAKDARGSTAIEFVLLVFPFVLMMFAIIETGLSFATQQVMSNATDDLARSLRVGELLAADVSQSSVKKAICDQIGFLVPSGCPDLYVDLKTYATYAAVPLNIPRKPDGDLNTAGFTATPGGSSSRNQIRVFYRWSVYLDFMRKYLADLPNGKTLLYSTLTWQNEEFPE